MKLADINALISKLTKKGKKKDPTSKNPNPLFYGGAGNGLANLSGENDSSGDGGGDGGGGE